MSDTDQLTSDLPIYDKNILEWRQEGFRRLGFPPNVADALAQTQVDLWEAKNLLDKGCLHATLIRILVGRTRSGDEDNRFSLKWLLSETTDHAGLAQQLTTE